MVVVVPSMCESSVIPPDALVLAPYSVNHAVGASRQIIAWDQLLDNRALLRLVVSPAVSP